MWPLSKAVRADLLSEAGDQGPGRLYMTLQQVPHSRSGQTPPLAVLEQRQVALIGAIKAALLHVIAQQFRRCIHDRHNAHFAPLAHQSDLGW